VWWNTIKDTENQLLDLFILLNFLINLFIFNGLVTNLTKYYIHNSLKYLIPPTGMADIEKEFS
jgi:hypothetical protein